MKTYTNYENPYRDIRIEPDTVVKLHAVTLGDNALSPYVASLSPFVTKLQAYFRMFGVEHEVVSEPVPDVGPRGKVPFISVGDSRITDSGLIVDFMKSHLRDPDTHLGPAQRALGQMVQGTLEDHLYWVILYYEFFDDAGWDFLMSVMVGDPTALPEQIQEALSARREDFRKRCHDQGIARFTPTEIVERARRDLAALDALIGANRYLLGDEHPSSYDAVLFGFTQAFFQARGMHPEITDFARRLPNLGRFIATVTRTWYPELKLAFEPA